MSEGCPDCERRMAMLLTYERRAYVAEGRVAALKWFLRAEGDDAIESLVHELARRWQSESDELGPAPVGPTRYHDEYRQRVEQNRQALNTVLTDADAAYRHYKRAVLGLAEGT